MHEEGSHMGPDRRKPAEVRLTQETIDYMTLLFQQAVSEGIRSAVTEEMAAKVMAAAITALQRQATERAGRAVMGGLLGLASKGTVFLLLGGLVYAVGGWSALAKLAKFLFSAGV